MNFRFKIPYLKKFRDERGFTFLELVFVITIFAILTGISIFNYQKFTSSVRLQNLAQDIALRIVQAQKAAISGSLNSNSSLGVAPSYGMYFSSKTNFTNNKIFIYFFDDGDGLLNNPPSNLDNMSCPGAQCISKTTITTGEYISKICTRTTTGNNENCGGDHVSITFTRPFPDATIKRDSGSDDIKYAKIEITSPDNSAKTITVSKVGQVSVRDGAI